MFRIAGRDERGNKRELSVCVGTEEEARAIAQGAGVVKIDGVSIPPPPQPSRLPKLNGFTVGALACLGCLGITALGAAIGFFIGDATEPQGNLIRTGWLVWGVVGAIVGLISGVSILVACLRRR